MMDSLRVYTIRTSCTTPPPLPAGRASLRSSDVFVHQRHTGRNNQPLTQLSMPRVVHKHNSNAHHSHHPVVSCLHVPRATSSTDPPTPPVDRRDSPIVGRPAVGRLRCCHMGVRSRGCEGDGGGDGEVAKDGVVPLADVKVHEESARRIGDTSVTC
jgi:hypothetical protein